jgi:hypothetical protein
MTELPFEGAAEARGIRKAQILGDRRDRLYSRRTGDDRMRFEQPLAVDVSGNTSHIFEQPIKIGAGHSNEWAQGLRL